MALTAASLLVSATIGTMRRPLDSASSALACAEDSVAINTSTEVAADGSSMLAAAAANTPTAATPIDTEHWTNYGFTITAPSSMWPMLELLHAEKFDWELASAAQRPTPL